MSRGNVSDVLGGLLFVALGAVGGYGSSNYAIGTADDMGPGYLPLGVFTILGILGAVITLQGLAAAREEGDGLTIRPAAAVLLGTTAFALLLRSGGLVLATVALVGITSFADEETHFGWSLVLGALLGLFGALVFVVGLGVPLPVSPWSK